MELMGGVDKEYAVLIDSQSVRRNRGNVLYWEIRYYATPQTSPVEKKLFQIGKTMFRGDCSNWTFTPIAGAFYTQDDKLVDQMNLPPSFQEAGNVVPGSYAEQEMKFLCK